MKNKEKHRTKSELAIDTAVSLAIKDNGLQDEDDIEERRVNSVKAQLQTLFKSVNNPDEMRAYAKKSVFSDTDYEPYLQDLLARGYGAYTIRSELRRQFGPKKILKVRNILGYVKFAILNKTDNLKLIKDLRYKYAVDNSDSQYEIEKEVLEKRREIKDRIKHRKRQLEKNIDDLYTRIEIMKKENRHKFNPNIEKQISSNYELIESFESQYKLIIAEERGITVDVENIRAETLQIVLSKAVNHFLPHVPKDMAKTILSALKVDVQQWVDSSTQLNSLSEAMSDGQNKLQYKRKIVQ